MKPFTYFLRVRYGECDAQNVVFNSRYGDYVDVAVNEFMRALGFGEALINGDLDFQLVKQTTEWNAPARFDQVLALWVSADPSRHHVVHPADRVPHRRRRSGDRDRRDRLRAGRFEDADEDAAAGALRAAFDEGGRRADRLIESLAGTSCRRGTEAHIL